MNLPSRRLLYSVKETRAALGDISHGGFYGLVNQGQLKIVKIGRRTFVSSVELDRFVAALAETAAAACLLVLFFSPVCLPFIWAAA